MSKETIKRRLVIPYHAVIEPGITQVAFSEKTYELLIGVGDDNTISLYIGEEALKALQDKKNKLNIETHHDFKCKNCTCGE